MGGQANSAPLPSSRSRSPAMTEVTAQVRRLSSFSIHSRRSVLPSSHTEKMVSDFIRLDRWKANRSDGR